MTTMTAVMKQKPTRGAVIETNREVPENIRPGEVLIKVAASAICGTDKHIYNWDKSIQSIIDIPVIFGHEFCGEVVKVGEKVEKKNDEIRERESRKGYASGIILEKGDFVSAEMHIVCNTCYQCRTGNRHICENTKIAGLNIDGSFAQYIKVSAKNVVKLDPECVPPKVGAFLDALGNAVHTALSTDLAGRTVAVLGYGPIGAMATAIADFAGAAEIFVTDVNPFAIEKAEEWKQKKNAARVHIYNTGERNGASVIKEIKRMTRGGVDIVLEMSGAELAINQALKVARKGGYVALLGLSATEDIKINDYDNNVIFDGVTIQGIIGRKMFDTWYRMLGLLKAGLDVESVVTSEYPSLEDFEDGMAVFDQGKALKVVFYPNGKPDK